jgi:DNA-binding MarR family transcriptional regulator
MLTKTEKAVMEFLYHKCREKNSCLTSFQEIILSLSHKIKITQAKLKEVMHSLEQDDYFDLILTERHGEEVIVVTLHLKGKAYPREVVQSGRQVKYKLILASIGAVLSFIIGKILYLIFT